MRASIFIREPNLLREAKAGDAFVVHAVALQECVCVRQTDEGDSVETDPRAVEDTVVVIACRVHFGEVGHRPAGHTEFVSLDNWVTFVEPVETLAFRERHADGSEAPAVATERATPGSASTVRDLLIDEATDQLINEAADKIVHAGLVSMLRTPTPTPG